MWIRNLLFSGFHITTHSNRNTNFKLFITTEQNRGWLHRGQQNGRDILSLSTLKSSNTSHSTTSGVPHSSRLPPLPPWRNPKCLNPWKSSSVLVRSISFTTHTSVPWQYTSLFPLKPKPTPSPTHPPTPTTPPLSFSRSNPGPLLYQISGDHQSIVSGTRRHHYPERPLSMNSLLHAGQKNR